ncbi:MAG: branched-chain amino acid ABC transporter substrate-binding protein [Alphaproteobacteria bacterium]|nr:branched-chain amino acid ABC transporter substrate-binding protein [Alphaproteobacteria bacterium]TAD91694.1 MAG: branched-chain amino acid ABC transporter substrate-binding protein [Alphaproteobacteria bacterium]
MTQFSRRTLAASVLALGLAGPAMAQQEIVIAVAGPITGQYAAFGEQMKRGAEMAVADLNAAGGINGRRVRLEVGDDACDPRQAVAVANQFVSRRVAFVAGHFCSGSSIPASAVYAEEGILQISPASTNPRLTEEAAAKGWTNVLRVCGRDDIQGQVAAAYTVRNFAGKRVAVLHDRSAYGQGLAIEFQKAYRAAGAQEAMFEAYTPGERDYTALVSRMRQQNIDVIYLGGYHTEGGLIIRQAREQGLQAQMIAADALVTDEFWSISGPAGQGTLMTFAPDPRNKPTAAPVVAKFQAANYNPEGYTLYTYAAVQVWAEAARKANSVDAKALGAFIRANKFQTVIGELGFDAKGDVLNPEYVMYVWRDGKYAQQ